MVQMLQQFSLSLEKQHLISKNQDVFFKAKIFEKGRAPDDQSWDRERQREEERVSWHIDIHQCKLTLAEPTRAEFLKNCDMR